jgi:peptidylprolyl isomerase
VCPVVIRKDPFVNRFFTSIATVAALGLLVGCASSDPVVDASIDPLVDGCAPSGSTVESMTISADRDVPPEVDYQAPVSVATTERMVVVEGSGEVIENLDQALIAWALYNGGSGEMLGAIGYGDEEVVPFIVDLAAPYLEGFTYTLLCSPIGSRVVGVIPAHQAWGDEGAPQFGLGPGDSVIFVADIHGVQPPPEPPLERLTGVIKDSPEGFPEVTYQMSGQPTVTVDTDNAPRDFQVARVIDGSGPEVRAGSSVVVHYHGVNLATGETFDSSWDRGEPTSFPTSGVIDGFRDGLVGQNVGSRVLIVIPPALGYGPQGGTGDGRIGADDTIFFVVDILGTF